MSTSPHAQPDPTGSFSPENAPQVVVRAGKTFVCSACGVLVEIPADVVGQLVLAVDHASQESAQKEPDANLPSQADPSDEATSHDQTGSERVAEVAGDGVSFTHRRRQAQKVLAKDPAPWPTRQTLRPPRPKRPRQPRPGRFAGEIIDGLIVPSAGELDRALAWVSFHLQVLDRQASEFTRLKKLLKQKSNVRVPSPSPLERAKEVPQKESDNRVCRMNQEHTQVDLGLAPEGDDANERGPP